MLSNVIFFCGNLYTHTKLCYNGCHGGGSVEIGQKLKAIRKQKDISQKALAEQSGVGLATIQRIEYGQFTPKRVTIHKLAKAMGIDDAELDDSLNEMLQKWNEQVNTEQLSKEVAVFDSLPNYDEDDLEVFRQFLSLNPDGKQKASEYIDLLMQKYAK